MLNSILWAPERGVHLRGQHLEGISMQLASFSQLVLTWGPPRSTERYDSVYTNILLRAGANATQRNKRFRDALTKALEGHDNSGQVKLVLESGVNVYTKDPRSSSPWSWAGTNNRSHCIPILLRYGADIKLADHDGDTPLMESLFFNSG